MIFDAIVWIAFAAAAAAALAGVTHIRGDHRGRTWMHRAGIVSLGASIVAFGILVALFILVRTEFQYVFLYTSLDIPLRYRIAGAWAGRQGSLLLWAVYAIAVAVAVARRNRHDNRVILDTLLFGIAAAFLGAVATSDLFGATDAFLRANRPGGNGLNPTLLNPFILIHPPVMFLAYALTAVPAAAVVSDMLTGRQEWSTAGMMWSRVNWTLYTFAMGLGGIWAYYTLGFGGYWAWDPVEVANLLPWLALTVFLHAQLHHRKHGAYRHIGLMLGLLPFLLTVFSTISTRSGLWVSVHAFTDPTGTFDPDAGRRILSILEREPSLQFHAAVFLFVLCAGLALWARRLASDTGKFERLSVATSGILGATAIVSLIAPRTVLGAFLEAADALPGDAGLGMLALLALAFVAPALPLLAGEEHARKKLDLRMFGLASIAILGIGLLVLFLWHIAAVNGWNTDAYYHRFPVLSTPAFLALTAFMLFGLNRSRMPYILAADILAAAVAAWIWGAVGYLLVLASVFLVTAIARTLRAGVWKDRRIGLSRSALWIAALLNVIFWLNPPAWLWWRPTWPSQLIFGVAAFVGLHLATRLLIGRTRFAGRTHLLVGILGGYGIAPILAAAAWFSRAKAMPVSSPGPRLHQVGLYGVHLAVALVLMGYVTTFYLGHETDLVLEPGIEQEFGGDKWLLQDTHIASDGRLIDSVHPRVLVRGEIAEATLYWEPQTGSHYPLPATLRFWDQDAYFAVDAICIDPTGTCDRASHWIGAYESSGRLPQGLAVTDIQIQAFTLPGISLIWAGLFTFVYAMGLIIRNGAQR